MFGSGEVVPAQPSQESHLLSPEISAAGSDNGQLEDLKGDEFPELVEAERHSLALAKESAAEAATPYHRQQTLLKTPASLANPTICSTSTSKSKHKPPQTTQKTGKSNNAKMSAKAALSASRRAAPINVQIVRLAPSSAPSSSSSSATPQDLGVAHSFSMNMLPMTKIRELCLHAAGHARRHFDAVLDGSRFEARDRDGHVFKGHETLSEETLSGETIYLVDGGLDARAEAKASRGSRGSSEKPRTGARERGRLLCLKSLELEEEGGEAKTPYRTPSVSSRASSSRSEPKGKAEQPKLTASQRALAIAQKGQTPSTQKPIADRRLPTSSAVKKSLPSPALEKVGESTEEEVRRGGTHLRVPPKTDDLDADLVPASPLRSSTPPLKQPQSPQQQHAVPPNLQDSQLVIPDSQDPFSQVLFSQQPVEPDDPAPTVPKPGISDIPSAQSRPSSRFKAIATQPKLQMSRPDPYDINTVLSDDDEHERSDGSSTNTTANIKMSSSVRKLGSATTQRRSVMPPPMSLPSPRQHQSNKASPLRANEATLPAVRRNKETPTKKSTPIKADPSSPDVPLPSSPTNHVAAAIVKVGQGSVGKNRTPQLPSHGQMVYHVRSDSDSDDELIEKAFRDLSSSIPTPSLPWSAPPLRAVPNSEKDVDNQPAPNTKFPGSPAGGVKYRTSIADEVSIVGVSPRKSPIKKTLGQSPSPGKKANHKSPTKTPIITSPSKIEEATIVHDSSSAEGSDHEAAIRIVKKEPLSSEESPLSRPKLADVPAIDENQQRVERKQPEVIELSSDSDSDLGPSWDMLDDDEAELPIIDAELHKEEQQLPPLPQSPAKVHRSPTRNSFETTSVKIEPAYKNPPRSAQANKRKRPASEEPDPRDEKRRRKRARMDAKKARKQRKREEKALHQERENQLAALQEKRKKLALEKAHRRALELESIVTSPAKQEPSIEYSEDGDDDDSGLGPSPHGDNAGADMDVAGVSLDGDDKNDSLSSKEAEGHSPSWRKLSKVHLSSSPPKGSKDTHKQDSLDHRVAHPTSTPAIIEAQLQQCVEERFHRMPFDDWAFLEDTLGKGLDGGHGYSPLEVHNRVHLDMMRRARRHPPGKKESSNARATHETVSKSPALPGRAGEGDASDPSRSQRSEAPSPKEYRASEEQQKENDREEKRARLEKRTKTPGKLCKERARKRERGSKAKVQYHRQFRGSRVGNEKKQKRMRKGQ